MGRISSSSSATSSWRAASRSLTQSSAYKTHGTLNETKDNAILFPHMWSGTPKAMEIFIGEDRPLDLRKYFVILPGQFANGFSSSPSNTPPPFDGGAFPNVTIGDDVRAQHRLLTERYGIKRLELVLGWSMGAEQTYEWAVRYPDMVKRALPFRRHGEDDPARLPLRALP